MSLSSTLRAASVSRYGQVREAIGFQRGAMRAVRRSGVNYARNVWWAALRTIEGRWLRFGWAIALGQLSLAAQAGAIGLLYWFADQTVADATVTFGPLGMELRARDDPLLLAAVVVLSGACLLSAAGLLYLSNRMVIRMAESALARRLAAVARVARRLPDPRAPEASRVLLSGGLGRVTRGSIYASQAFIVLAGALTPLAGAIVGSGVLFALDPELTTIIAVAAALWCGLLYPLMKRQTQVLDQRLRWRRAFSAETAEYLRAPAGAGVPAPMKSAGRLAGIEIGRRHLANAVKMVLSCGVAVIGTGAALAIAYRIMTGGGDWPTFIVYVGAMRVVLGGGFSVPASFNLVSRHYPRLVVYIRFLQDAAGLDREAGRIGAGESVMLGTLPDGTPVAAGAGDRITVASLDAPLQVQGAFLGARSAASGPGLVADWMRSHDGGLETGREEASIRLVEAPVLGALETEAARAALDGLSGSVTAVVHFDEKSIGAFGETRLIVVGDGAFTAAAPLGAAEGDALLAEFAAARRAVEDARRLGGFNEPGAGEEEEE